MLNKIADSCHYYLNNLANATTTKTYINSRLSQTFQNSYNIGFFPDINYLINEYSEDTLLSYKLFYKKSINNSYSSNDTLVSFFENYPLIIPYKDVYGNTLALVGRTLLSEANRKELNISKYKNTIFKKGQHLFGLYEAKEAILESNQCYVVEGQFDAIKCHEKGIMNVVALGNSNMTAYQLSLLLRYTRNINLLLDNDEAGIKGRQLCDNKYSKFVSFKNLYVPEIYKDVDEYLINNDNFDNLQLH